LEFKTHLAAKTAIVRRHHFFMSQRLHISCELAKVSPSQQNMKNLITVPRKHPIMLRKIKLR
jgi:hypothetical protein